MAGNRVEELETKVRELEATVSGLTDELVETKERLRFVEDELGQDIDDLVEGRASRRQARNERAGRERRRQETPRDEPRAEASASEQASDESAADEAVAADEAKSDEAEGEEDGSEASDDIIVA